jgi:hypothetical protein
MTPTETDLIGNWILERGRIVGDPVENRIGRLVKTHLKRIASTGGGWETLYQDRRWTLLGANAPSG